MTNAELDALEEAAKAASRGPWHTSVSDSCYVIDAGNYIVCETSGICGANKDAAYIAAANPAVVLELIADLLQERQNVKALESVLAAEAQCRPI